jgi:hypothetical protein
MSRCALCGQPTGSSSEICIYHLPFPADDGGAGNRIMCDFADRNIVPPRPRERADALELLVDTLDESSFHSRIGR